MVAASAFDLRARRVPNPLNLALGLAGLGWQLAARGPQGLLEGALGSLTGFALVILPFALRLYRGGDAKLVIALGAWLGPAAAAWAFLYGVALGGVVALGLVAWAGPELRARVRRNLDAAARTLSVPQVEAREARAHVPMALAFSLGALFALHWR